MKKEENHYHSGKPNEHKSVDGGKYQSWLYTNIYETAKIHNNVRIGSFVEIGHNVEIGEDTSIGTGSFIPEGVTIGKNVFIGPRVVFCNDKRPPSHKRFWLTTIVEDGAVIGANVTILPGVQIGAGAIVGAGAVVTKNVLTKQIVYGNPARNPKQ